MAKLLLGKEVTAAMNEKLQARVAALKEKGVSPKLAIVRCFRKRRQKFVASRKPSGP